MRKRPSKHGDPGRHVCACDELPAPDGETARPDGGVQVTPHNSTKLLTRHYMIRFVFRSYGPRLGFDRPSGLNTRRH